MYLYCTLCDLLSKDNTQESAKTKPSVQKICQALLIWGLKRIISHLGKCAYRFPLQELDEINMVLFLILVKNKKWHVAVLQIFCVRLLSQLYDNCDILDILLTA